MARKKRAARRGANARKAVAEIEKATKDLQLSLKGIKEKLELFHFFSPDFHPHERKGKY